MKDLPTLTPKPNPRFSPEIRTIDPPSKWILRGVALLTYQGDAG